MPPELLELMQQAEQLMAYITQNGASLNAETQQSLGGFLQQTMQFIEQFQQNAQQEVSRQPFQGQVEPTINEQPPSDSVQLLWILSGQNEDVFVQYLQTYPDPSFRTLLNNPGQLNNVIEYLNAIMPPGELPIQPDGMYPTEFPSSNVSGLRYDPKTKKLLVKFHSDGVEPIYQYDGVPSNIAELIVHGQASASTKGSNKWGRWWPLKSPSIGASVNQYLKQGGYNYSKIA